VNHVPKIIEVTLVGDVEGNVVGRFQAVGNIRVIDLRLQISDKRSENICKFFMEIGSYKKWEVKIKILYEVDLKVKRVDLENRLIDFAVNIVKLVNKLPNRKMTNHFYHQLTRSGSSPAMNYAESQSAESRKDFIHKMSIALKELRETHVCLKIIKQIESNKHTTDFDQIIDECNQLISIFVKSIITAKNTKPKTNSL